MSKMSMPRTGCKSERPSKFVPLRKLLMCWLHNRTSFTRKNERRLETSLWNAIASVSLRFDRKKSKHFWKTTASVGDRWTTFCSEHSGNPRGSEIEKRTIFSFFSRWNKKSGFVDFCENAKCWCKWIFRHLVKKNDFFGLKLKMESVRLTPWIKWDFVWKFQNYFALWLKFWLWFLWFWTFGPGLPWIGAIFTVVDLWSSLIKKFSASLHLYNEWIFA